MYFLDVRARTLLEKLTHKLSIPEDILAGGTLINMEGGYLVTIENYKHIVEISRDLIKVQGKTARIHIIGKELGIAYYTSEQMAVVGNISTIEYRR